MTNRVAVTTGNGGFIDVKYVVGEGIVFSVFLPRHIDDKKEPVKKSKESRNEK